MIIPTWARITKPHYPMRLDQPYSKVNQRFPGNPFRLICFSYKFCQITMIKAEFAQVIFFTNRFPSLNDFDNKKVKNQESQGNL